jgi:glutathione S-transferase
MHKLYYSPNSCSLAPHIVLEEIGEPYEAEIIQSTDSLMTGTPEWHAINPKGRVPVLTGVPGSIGGAPNILTEVPAILNFLGGTYPEAKLLPADVSARARANEWMNWLSSNVHALSFAQIWRPQRFVDDPSCNDAIRAKGRSNLVEQFAYIERLLEDGRDWSVPGAYSIVDPYLLVFWRWTFRIELDVAPYPAFTELAQRVMTRPAAQAVMRRTGIA